MDSPCTVITVRRWIQKLKEAQIDVSMALVTIDKICLRSNVPIETGPNQASRLRRENEALPHDIALSFLGQSS